MSTDAEFIAELKVLAENATGLPDVPWEARNGDVWFDGERVARDCWTPDAAFIAAARTAIPRLIGMVEAEKKRADDAEAWASCSQQDRDLANDTLYNAASHEEKAATERNAEIAERICIERNDAQDERDTALAEVARLRAAMFDILENVDEPPDSNCSCHISPPCNDCVDYAGLRRALKEGYAALASKE